MKTILCLLAAMLLCPFAKSGIEMGHTDPAPNVLNTSDFSSPAAPSVVTDPWRIINGQLQKVDGTWLAVSGNIAQVHPNEGVRINGRLEGVYQEKDFFCVNLPISGGEGDSLPPAGVVLLVKPAGTYTYSTAGGSTRTIRKYDYGIPAAAPVKTAAEIEQEKLLAAKRKIEGEAAILKLNQKQAEQGDAEAQLRMAERYRDGNGVETNVFKAKFLFMASADQGNAKAAKELFVLTNSPAQK